MKSALLLLLAGAAVASTSTSSLFVAARPDMAQDPCTFNWNGPQDSFSCSLNTWENVQEWMDQLTGPNQAYLVVSSIVLIIGIVAFYLIPFTMILRYCCGLCGNSKLRPGHGFCGGSELDNLSEETKLSMYTASEVWWTKFLTYVVLVLSLVACVLCVHGGIQTGDIVDVVSSGSTGFGNWVDGKLTAVKAELNVTNPKFARAVTKMDDIQSDIHKFTSHMNDFNEHIDDAKNGVVSLAAPSVFVLVIAIGAAVAALCSVRSYLPFSLLVSLTITILVVGCLGFAMGVVGLTVNIWDAEVTAYNNNQTGLLNWYVAPNMCEQKVSFPHLKNTIQSGIDALVSDSCTALATNCDANASSIIKPFYCATPPTAANCKTTQDLVDALKTITVKTGVAGKCPTGTCTVNDCATSCTVASLKSKSEEAVSNSNQANKAFNGIKTILYPLLDCKVILNKLLGFFDICSDNIKNGLACLTAGYFLSTLACLFLAIVLFCGQKRYISAAALEKIIDQKSMAHHEQFAPHEDYIVNGKEVPISII